MPIHSRAFRKLPYPIALAFLITGCLATSAQTTPQAIEARLKGHPLYLRGQWAPNDLKFDLTGTTSSPAVSAPFTLCGIDVKQIKLKKDHLEIYGDRVGLEFDDYTPERISLSTEVEIRISGSPDADYGPALDKIFAEGLEDLGPSMPFYWQNYRLAHLITSAPAASTAVAAAARPQIEVQKAPMATPLAPAVDPPATDQAGEPLRKTGNGVTPPTPIHEAEPRFSDEARAAKFTGNVLVQTIVNSQGLPENVHVVRGVGMGLDESAVEAVRQYRFRPAMENGKPVPMLIYVQINFQFFQSPKTSAAAQKGSVSVNTTSQMQKAGLEGIHPPHVLESHEPVFTDAAKTLRYANTSLVHIRIKVDGTVVEPDIVRPAGLGLDEEALRAVAQYRFKPATRDDGTPVSVIIQFEVHFKVE